VGVKKVDVKGLFSGQKWHEEGRLQPEAMIFVPSIQRLRLGPQESSLGFCMRSD